MPYVGAVLMLGEWVDFHWEVDGRMYEFSLPGGGFISLSELIEALGVVKTGGNDDAYLPREVPSIDNQDENGENNTQENTESTENTGYSGVEKPMEVSGINSQELTALTLNNVKVSEATIQFVADVESVVFSSPELVWVGKVEEESTVGGIKEENGLEVQYSAELTEEKIAQINAQTAAAGDWALISMQPFTSEEMLTVTMNTGEVFNIRVTDAQLKKTVLTASGETYEITVTYGEDAKIPDGAELRIREILPEDEKYKEYCRKTTDAVKDTAEVNYDEYSASADDADTSTAADESAAGPDVFEEVEKDGPENNNQYIRLFDIQIWNGEEKIEPQAEVLVNIRLMDVPDNAEELPTVVHFSEEGPEMMELVGHSEDKTAFSFRTDGFSVYSVAYTIDFLFEINGKEYAFSLEGGDSTSFKEIIEKFEILDKEDEDLFIENIADVEFTNPEYLWNGRLEEDAFAGELKEKYNLSIQYASNIRPGNILAMNVHHYSAPDWVLIALKPFASEELLTITMKSGEVFYIKVTDAQSDAVHNSDGTVQTISNPQGTTFELFNYYVSEDTKTTAKRDQWPGHIHDDVEFWKFDWYNFDGSYARSWNEGYWYNDAEVPENWRQGHLLGKGNNIGINKGHVFKFSPANAGTVIDGTKSTVTKDVDGGSGLNGWTQDADPNQGIVEGTLVNGYPKLTVNDDLGTDGESLAYLFDGSAHEGKDSYGAVNHLLYVDPEGYYTYDSRDFKAQIQNDGNFVGAPVRRQRYSRVKLPI